jgi:hypothetical protein
MSCEVKDKLLFVAHSAQELMTLLMRCVSEALVHGKQCKLLIDTLKFELNQQQKEEPGEQCIILQLKVLLRSVPET